MLFGPKLEEVVAKSLKSKIKLRGLFSNLKKEGTSQGNMDSKNQQPFQNTPLLHAKENRRKGIFSQARENKGK